MVTFTVTLNKSTYAPGESIRLNAVGYVSAAGSRPLVNPYSLSGGLDGSYSQMMIHSDS